MEDTYELDAQDKRLIQALSEDGQSPVGKLSEKLGVTSPTVRTRVKNLVASGVLKVAGMVDPFKAKGLTVALVGITLKDHKKLGEKMEQLAELDNINWVAVVTGRYDIIVEVTLSAEITDMYRFINEDLSQVGGIASSESFMVMAARRKWVYLPKGILDWFN